MKTVIEIQNLNYLYPDGSQALEGVTFTVCRGETLGIVGPNGAGKSTLLLHLNGILMDKTSVKILGMEVNQANLRLVRSKVGLVFQDPDNQLFMPTVREDVGYGPMNMGFKKEEVERRVGKALEQVDMGDSAHRLAHHLSFGEKKRVSVATVLSMDTEILVLDEPTSNLDPRHRRELIILLNRFSVTKVIATHDLDMVLDTCRRVILLDRGRIVADGDSKDILGNKELMEKHDLEVPYRLR
jgi:cobalt/nickel transport system ATP-binding protein